MIRALVFLVACSSKPPPPAAPLAKDQVCEWGTRHTGDRTALPGCGSDLQCCYPCGIPGCDSVCMAVAACPLIP